MGAAEKDDPASKSWHLDRRLPVAMIVALMMQGSSFLWWASGFSARTDTRLEAAEKRLHLTEDILRKVAEAQHQLATQVAISAATQHTLAALTAKLELRLEQINRTPASDRVR
jgi:hypothetical protein